VALATGVTEYGTEFCPWQTGVGPLIVPAADGNKFIANTKVLLTPFPQALTGVTVTVPALAEVLKSAVILVLVPDAVPPEGKDQL